MAAQDGEGLPAGRKGEVSRGTSIRRTGSRSRRSETNEAGLERRPKPILHLLWLLCVVIAACRPAESAQRERAFSDLFPYEDRNRSIVLSPVEGLPGSRHGGAMTLQVENLSDGIIAFPADDGVRGFVYDRATGGWVEIPNAIQFSPEVTVALGRRGSGRPSIGVVDYEPASQTMAASPVLRIVVVGYVYDEESQTLGDPVAAYVDLALEE